MHILQAIREDRSRVVVKGNSREDMPSPETQHTLRGLVDLAADGNPTAVEITNVADWYFLVHPGSMQLDEDFPNVAPPWPDAWYEYVFPGSLLNGKKMYYNERAKGTRIGVFQLTEFQQDTLRWKVRNAVFTRYRQKPEEIVYHGLVEYDVPLGGGKPGKPTMSTVTTFLDPHKEWILSNSCTPVAMAISLAHCKNVTTVDHRPPEKVAKKRRKQGKPIGITYKTLMIDGMKEVLRTEGNVEKNGLKKALHICRGHFATYTEDKPLFGKVTGTFWKPMHTRGSKKRGEVRKDYKVIADGTKGH